MKISILLPAFKRPGLLEAGLTSIRHFKPNVEFEILVLNDGLPDLTEKVCTEFPDLNIRYIFTGKRNLEGEIKSRVPGFALNIGIQQATGHAIILSCPEMYHLNNAIDQVADVLSKNPRCMVIPDIVLFDDENKVTPQLISQNTYKVLDKNLLRGGEFGKCHGEMPYLFGIMKQELLDIRGYDEDFTGYAGEDCDLIWRLKDKGLTYKRCGAEVVHLYHEGTNDGTCHWDNPAWVYNYALLLHKKGQVQRNLSGPWGVL